jgi:hypothetical protein
MLFLDTEFTGFCRPTLVSMGLVDGSGARMFYGVVEDFDQAPCSDFMRESVLPKMHARFPACDKAAGGAFKAAALGKVLADWLAAVRAAQGGGRVLVVFDYWADGDLLLEVLGAQRPDWLDLEDVGAKLPPSIPDQAEHEMRHHALFDALQLRRVYLEAQAAGAVGWV